VRQSCCPNVAPPAERELSDNFGDRAAAGRRSPDDGIVGGNTARGAVRPDSRRHPDDVVERARYDFDYAAIRPQPRHRRRLDRHAGRHQRCEWAVAARDDLSADDPQGESRGHADPGTRANFEYAAADHDRRLSCFRKFRRYPESASSPSAASKSPPSGFRSIRRRLPRAASVSKMYATS
jgi:hypothetical protein